MMENIEDSWFLRWDEEDVDLRKELEREKLEDSGKKEMIRKVLIRGGFGPARFPGGTVGRRWQRHCMGGGGPPPGWLYFSILDTWEAWVQQHG